MYVNRSSYFLLGIGICLFHVYNYSLIAATVNNVISTSNESLRLLQIVWRHGDRAALTIYPKDPYKSLWENMGIGQLTDLGKMQHFMLGKYLRSRYRDFLPENFNTSLVRVRSLDMDRVLMSGSANLAGMFPPSGKILPSLMWQPIPLHTVPYDTDLVLNAWSDCPRYDQLYAEVLNTTEIKNFLASIQDIIAKMEDFLGGKGDTLDTAWTLWDCIHVEKLNNFTLPSWVYSEWNRMNQIDVVSMDIIARSTDMARLRGGPLLKEWLNNIKNKIATNSPLQLHLYSAQDGSLSTLQQALGVYDNIPPPLASALWFELHEINKEYYIQILYKNDTTKDPHVLVVPECTPLCPLTELEQLVKDKQPDNIEAECGY